LLDSIFSNPCTTHGHKHGCHVRITIGSRPLVKLYADDDVIGTASRDLLSLGLVLRNPMLQDVGDDVKTPVVFSLGHENVVAAFAGVLTLLSLTTKCAQMATAPRMLVDTS
jgi:hypothetical protein